MTLQLHATARETTTRGGRTMLRKSMNIPAVVYGHGKNNQNVMIEYHAFEKLFTSAGMSNLIDLTIAGEKHALKVLVSEVQRDPINDRIIHIDLHQVRMDEKIKTEIHLEFSGESPAVKSLGGNLIINADKLNVECLPNDLVPSIVIDISKLVNLDDSIHIRDLVVPKGITVLDDADGSVVSVLAPREEKVEEVVTAEPALVGEETAPAAEGAAAVPAEPAPEKKKT